MEKKKRPPTNFPLINRMYTNSRMENEQGVSEDGE